MRRSAIAIGLVATIGLLVAGAGATAAEPTDAFLGKTQEQWGADLKSESASQRQLAAWALAQMPGVSLHSLLAAAAHDDPVVRFWATQGIARIPDADSERQFMKLLQDRSPAVRIAAADAIIRLGRSEDGVDAGLHTLSTSLSDPQDAVRIQAISSLERLGAKAAPLKEQIEKATADSSEYVQRISARLLAKLAARE